MKTDFKQTYSLTTLGERKVTSSAHLAFIWLFLAAASLAVMGSGRLKGTGEFLGKTNLNKLKNQILKEKNLLHIEEEYLDSRPPHDKASCRTRSCSWKRVYLTSISVSSQCVAGSSKQNLTDLTLLSAVSLHLHCQPSTITYNIVSKHFCVTARRLTSASSSKAKTNLWRELFLAHSALPPQYKFQKTMQHQSFDRLLSYPQPHPWMNPISPRLCFIRNMAVWSKGEKKSSLMTNAHNKCKSKSGHK